MAFFPCIHFCEANAMIMRGDMHNTQNWTLSKKMDYNILKATERLRFHVLLMQLFAICDNRQLRLILENPYSLSGEGYLRQNFLPPTFIDKNRTLRGDYFTKPTGYWFLNAKPTIGYSYQNDKPKRTIRQSKKADRAGLCSEERSMISPDYARNFICDFVIGKAQQYSEPSLFEQLC